MKYSFTNSKLFLNSILKSRIETFFKLTLNYTAEYLIKTLHTRLFKLLSCMSCDKQNVQVNGVNYSVLEFCSLIPNQDQKQISILLNPMSAGPELLMSL